MKRSRFTLLFVLLVVGLFVGATAASAEDDVPLYMADIAWGDSYETFQCGADERVGKANLIGRRSVGRDARPRRARPNYCWGEIVRCKTQYFRQDTYFGVPPITTDIIRYAGYFKVCYVWGNRITQVVYRYGDSIFSRYPYVYKGNATGYPKHFREQHYVDFLFRYQVDFCPAQPACTSTKWPYFTIRFHDNNTQERFNVGIG